MQFNSKIRYRPIQPRPVEHLGIGEYSMVKEIAKKFDEDGYVVVRGLLSYHEIQEYRIKLQNISGLSDKDFNPKTAKFGGWYLTDGVTQTKEFWQLIKHTRLVASLREIFGSDIRYAQHSDLHVHHGTVGWHRDSAYRIFGVGPDWDESSEKYQIARVAIYLQSYVDSGFKLGVIPGSHRHSLGLLANYEIKVRHIIERMFKKESLSPITTSCVWIKIEAGDCVIFDQRILHTGSYVYGPKYSIFLSYGRENKHLYNHRDYYWNKRKELGYKPCPRELQILLENDGLYLHI